MSDILKTLRETFNDKQVISGEMISMDYCRDQYPGNTFSPEAVVEVSSTTEISEAVKICNEAGVPVTVRGAGTGKAGGSAPIKGGVVISVKNMTNIISFDEERKTLTLQPGVLLQDVKSEAEKHSLFYPPDPGEKTATIGGNASTNASGPNAVKYGCTRDYIVDAVIVLADGTVVKLSEKEMYKAVIGSEGTLAIISELTLKLVKKPLYDVILLLPFMDAETCINAAKKIFETDFSPAIVEYLDTDIIEFSGNVTGNPVFPIEMDGTRVGATLMVTLEGDSDDELDTKMETIAELAEELKCLDILVVDTPILKRDTWDAHNAFHTATESAKSSDELNVSVPAENIAELINYAKTLGKKKNLKVMPYAHVGSGGIHIHVVSDMTRDLFAPVMAEFANDVYNKCVNLNGEIRGEYGIGYAKKELLKAVLSTEKYTEIQLEKASFDPNGIMNPGKVVN